MKGKPLILAFNKEEKIYKERVNLHLENYSFTRGMGYVNESMLTRPVIGYKDKKLLSVKLFVVKPLVISVFLTVYLFSVLMNFVSALKLPLHI